MDNIKNPTAQGTVSPTYTTDMGPIQDKIKQTSDAIKSGYNEIPTLHDTLAQRVSAEEGMLKPLTEDRGAMIQKLFEHDKNFGANYAAPTSETFIENPMAREAGIQAQQAPMWNALSVLGGDITTRRQLLGDAISRAVEAKKAELLGKQSELDNLWKVLGLYQAQQQQAAEKEKLVYQDAGDKIVGLNAAGEIKVTIPKGVVGDSNTQAILDAIKKGNGTTATTTVDQAAGTEMANSPEEEAKAFANVMQTKQTSQLEKRKAEISAQIKMGSFSPDLINELNKIDEELTRRKGGGTNLSGALTGLTGSTALTPKQPTGLNLGSTNSGLNGLNLGLSIDPVTGQVK